MGKAFSKVLSRRNKQPDSEESKSKSAPMDLMFEFDSESDREEQGEEKQPRRNSDTSESFEDAPEEAAEGRRIFLTLIRSEIEHNGIDETSVVLPDEGSGSSDGERFEFQDLLEHLISSTTGDDILMEAQRIPLDALSEEIFFTVFQGLFQDELERDKIAAAFVFSAGLAMESLLREGHREKFDLVLEWTLKFITTVAAPWIRHNGGW